jgi:acyl dehydratase
LPFHGGIFAHGVLVVGLISTCSTKILDHAAARRPAVSYGYDRIRFINPVRVREPVTVTYEIVATNLDESMTTAMVTATNQHGELVAVADHILKFL